MPGPRVTLVQHGLPVRRRVGGIVVDQQQLAGAGGGGRGQHALLPCSFSNRKYHFSADNKMNWTELTLTCL